MAEKKQQDQVTKADILDANMIRKLCDSLNEEGKVKVWGLVTGFCIGWNAVNQANDETSAASEYVGRSFTNEYPPHLQEGIEESGVDSFR